MDDPEQLIVKAGDPLLRTRCRELKNVSEASRVCESLIQTLRKLKGAGLAAPQIGVPYRVFVVEVKKTLLFPDREESPLFTVINPILEPIGSEETLDFEGCFSVPAYLGRVPRYRKVRVKWTDQNGSLHDEIFDNYLARVFQHEMDHLNGLLYLDRMQDMLSFSTRENYLRARLEAGYDN